MTSGSGRVYHARYGAASPPWNIASGESHMDILAPLMFNHYVNITITSRVFTDHRISECSARNFSSTSWRIPVLSCRDRTVHVNLWVVDLHKIPRGVRVREKGFK